MCARCLHFKELFVCGFFTLRPDDKNKLLQAMLWFKSKLVPLNLHVFRGKRGLWRVIGSQSTVLVLDASTNEFSS